MKYWVQQRGEIRGPFEWDELKRLAAERKVRPDDKISTDQHQWLIAARVPGLMSLSRGGGETPFDSEAQQMHGQPIDDESLIVDDEEEYRLSPVEEPTPAEPVTPAIPAKPELPPGVRRAIEIPQQPRGMALGGLLGVSLLLLSLPLAAVINIATGGQIGGLLTIVPSCAAIFAVGLFIVATMGTSSSLEVEVTSKGSAHVTLNRRFAYVRYSQWQSYVVVGDQLQKRIKSHLGIFTDATVVDIAMFIVLGACCAMGGIPGAIIWMAWFRSRGEGENMCDFRLVLLTRENPSPGMMYREKVPDYFATRFGTPLMAEKMIKLIQAAVPEVEVSEVEE